MDDTIGVFGGSFNPVHHGHLILAQDVLETFELESVIFVPCGRPAHKHPADLADAEHRLAMLEPIADLDPRFAVSDREIRREGISYTIDTLEALSRKHGGQRLCFIVGSDTLPELHTWRRIDDLLASFSIVSLVRPGYSHDELKGMPFHLGSERKEQLLENLVLGHRVDISSSDIRMRIAEGMSISYLVPPHVEMYIAEHGLYRA